MDDEEEIIQEVDDSSDPEDLLLYTDQFRENFKAKYRENKSGCWIWTAKRDPDGYGQMRVGKKIKRAHRISYELASGKAIPIGEDGKVMDIDHLCHIRSCVNPDHLEAVTHKINMQRLRKTESWQVDEPEFKAKTTTENVMEEVLGIIERSKIEPPLKNVPVQQLQAGVEQGYAVAKVTDAPWRDCQIEGGYIAQDKYSLISLFFTAISLGANWKVACVKILDISPSYLQNAWLKNPDFADDFRAAKTAGKKNKYEFLEDMHIEELERKIHTADFKDIASSLKGLREAENNKKNKETGGGNAPAIQIVFQGAPESMLRNILSASDEMDEEDDA